EAIEKGHKDFLVLGRESGRNRRKQLKDQTERVVAAVEEKGGRVREVVGVIERGKLAGCGPKRGEAGRRAVEMGWTIAARDWTRLFRPIAYDSKCNRDAWPTDKDFARVMEMYHYAGLATLLDPYVTDSKLRSIKILENTDCGRPSKFDAITE